MVLKVQGSNPVTRPNLEVSLVPLLPHLQKPLIHETSRSRAPLGVAAARAPAHRPRRAACVAAAGGPVREPYRLIYRDPVSCQHVCIHTCSDLHIVLS